MEQLKWETKKVKVKDLIQLDINPRKISEDKKQKLVESLEKFNLVEIPAVNTDLQIIGGNQRVTALLLVGRGEEEIDVRFPNRKLTKKEVKEYAIISNTHAGEFDFEILDLEFADISIGELGFEIEGWDDWKNKQDTLLAGEAQEDDFDVPVGGSETDIVLGDLFEIGEHRLLCGDSTDSDSVDKLMNGEKADMVFTDPPYGISIVGDNGKVGGDNKAKNGVYSKVIADETTDTARKFYNTCIALGMENFIIWGGNYFVDFLPFSASWIIWDKRGDMNSNNFADGEMAWCSFETRVRIYKQLWNGMIREGEKDKRVHPTQKPIKVLSEIITDQIKGNLIFDGFLGSGSTMVAAHQLNRKCYGMELDSKYCEVIVTRMIKLDNTLTIKRNGVDETKKWLEKIA